MRGLPIIILLLIPAFIALGHDAYLFYERFLNPGVFSLDLLMQEFKLSALGFIWTTYDVESYKMTVESMMPEDWATIDYLLTFKAFHVSLGFAAAFIVPLVLLALFGKGPFANPDAGVVYGANNKGFASKAKKKK